MDGSAAQGALFVRRSFLDLPTVANATKRNDDDGECLGAGDVVAATGVRLSADRGRLGFVVAGVVVGGAGMWASVVLGNPGPGDVLELAVLAVLAVGSALVLSFVTRSSTGTTVVVNPAVCFTFAILLTWGLLPAVTLTVAAAAAMTWRRRLPPLQGLLMAVQVDAALGAADGVLLLGGTRGRSGLEWTSVRNAAIVIASTAAWLAAYAAVGYLLSCIDSQRLGGQLPTPTGYGLLFNAALVVLSPVVGVAAETTVPIAVLVLVPLFAIQRMAQLSAEKERAARLDPLTSLANRGKLHDEFERLAADSDRSGKDADRVALVLLDLDRFRQVNDSLGHDVGDRLLQAVASRLASVDIGEGTVARVGADEFAFLAHVPRTTSGDDLAERAMRALRGPVRLDGIIVDVTASAGLATRAARSGDDFETVIRHADIAMHDAKRHGDAIAGYQHQTDQDSPEQFQLLTDFRQALVNDDTAQISMHYQPQVSLATGAVDGLEALLRWTHPKYGVIDTATVLGVAEHTAVMQLLTAHVVDWVTAQLAAWRRDGPTPRVAVNISARDLYGEDIATRLRDRVEEHHLPPHALQVEVTESALIADPNRAGATLRAITDLGIDIALDDFGTGYSSLERLRHIPLDEIKIDRTFVAGMADNRHDAAIVDSTINLAHALGLRVVAEGVANEHTRILLTNLGCDLGQGWHWSRALPAEAISNLISHNPSAG
jgi:diguanylate cyclase (GGDEF)-like protein